MGIDAGFDMVPSLFNGVTDRHNWDRFIDIIKEHYKDDAQVEIMPNYINFKVGNHTRLPFEGHNFLRFSSKVSGAIAYASEAEHYIDTVTRVARVHFGSRIQYWNEATDQRGVYDWDQVYQSIRSYEQPDNFETPVSIAHFLSGTDYLRELNIPLFEIKNIPGKGKGIVAHLNISTGTRILCAAACSAIEGHAKEVTASFLPLHNNFPWKYPFSGRMPYLMDLILMFTASMPLGASSTTAAFRAPISWNTSKEHATIHAIRPIKSGTEIPISYDHGGPSSIRKRFLENSFGFTCTCNNCTLAPLSLQASDKRRTEMQILDEAIGNPFRMMSSPHESLHNCYSLLRVLEQEYDGHAGALIARLYYNASQICIAHMDQARASILAERAYQDRVICEGEDSPDTKRMKSLASKPADHGSFGVYSNRWQTSRESIAKGLDTVQFNTWLFRQEE
ncbi:hypothetical protein N7456_007077 [Penicillium angulare]|uniref:SET domain-containing protein n=1 Tax=Penicillium angulare TaxID=116970 RepID=A0A9W9FIF4_9EURO|nr:hypothetical protein N7456_006827 [Penicillium angulare]KAJ5100920.1 hypothetical protein N7456_006972 [Penicillium angulare]KAJ5101025.1 hypothetical protein N7456_007077 [Penicillium angulare]